jgi:peptidoglycan hydrolase CwlO-like protein
MEQFLKLIKEVSENLVQLINHIVERMIDICGRLSEKINSNEKRIAKLERELEELKKQK